MKLCQNLSLLLKRLEIDKNQFFDGLFSESRFYLVFSGAKFTKISSFFLNIFTINTSIFYENIGKSGNLE